MMVDPGERQIFVGEVSQALERSVRSQATGSHFGEQALELLWVHATWASGSRYSRKIAWASPIDSIWKRR